MSWPAPQDYLEAIQNPRLCFNDPELQSGNAETDKLGLPKPISGAFASVYRMKCGTKDWAVRCFTNNVTDQKRRYDAISQHLASAKLPYTIPFVFQSQGIKVHGNWYPIVKMQWIQGESLTQYISRNLTNSSELIRLSKRWMQMMIDLRLAKVAHGDLQHGNVLVENGDFRLIDYDGMFVPALNGMGSNELGHRNYQHPLRDNRDFGPHIDNFSVWVIFLSIVAVSIDPTLWDVLGAGEDEERLIFQQDDFKSPDTARSLRVLEGMNNPKLNSYLTTFRGILKQSVSKVPLPDLTDFKTDVNVTTVSHHRSSRTTTAHPAWLADFINFEQPMVNTASASTLNNTGSTWVLDHIRPEAKHSASNTSSFILERIISALFFVVIVCLMTTLIEGITTSTVSVTGIVGGLAISLWSQFICFKRLPNVKEKTLIKHIVIKLRDELKTLEHEEKNLVNLRENIVRNEEAKIEMLGEDQRNIPDKEKDDIAQLDQELRGTLNAIFVQRKDLEQQERTELSAALERHRQRWLINELRKHKVSSSKIRGIGSEMKKRLTVKGISSAADFIDVHYQTTYGRHTTQHAYIVLANGRQVHVEGVGRSKAASLLKWRKNLESKYRSQMTQAVPQAELSNIKSRFSSKRSALDTQVRNETNVTSQKKLAIQDKYAAEMNRITSEINTIRLNLNSEVRKHDAQINSKNADVSRKKCEVSGYQRQLESYKETNFSNHLQRVHFLRR